MPFQIPDIRLRSIFALLISNRLTLISAIHLESLDVGRSHDRVRQQRSARTRPTTRYRTAQLPASEQHINREDRMASMMTKRQQARNEKALQDLLRNVPGNDKCADCSATNPGKPRQFLG